MLLLLLWSFDLLTTIQNWTSLLFFGNEQEEMYDILLPIYNNDRNKKETRNNLWMKLLEALVEQNSCELSVDHVRIATRRQTIKEALPAKVDIWISTHNNKACGKSMRPKAFYAENLRTKSLRASTSIDIEHACLL